MVMEVMVRLPMVMEVMMELPIVMEVMISPTPAKANAPKAHGFV